MYSCFNLLDPNSKSDITSDYSIAKNLESEIRLDNNAARSASYMQSFISPTNSLKSSPIDPTRNAMLKIMGTLPATRGEVAGKVSPVAVDDLRLLTSGRWVPIADEVQKAYEPLAGKMKYEAFSNAVLLAASTGNKTGVPLIDNLAETLVKHYDNRRLEGNTVGQFNKVSGKVNGEPYVHVTVYDTPEAKATLRKLIEDDYTAKQVQYEDLVNVQQEYGKIIDDAFNKAPNSILHHITESDIHYALNVQSDFDELAKFIVKEHSLLDEEASSVAAGIKADSKSVVKKYQDTIKIWLDTKLSNAHHTLQSSDPTMVGIETMTHFYGGDLSKLGTGMATTSAIMKQRGIRVKMSDMIRAGVVNTDLIDNLRRYDEMFYKDQAFYKVYGTSSVNDIMKQTTKEINDFAANAIEELKVRLKNNEITDKFYHDKVDLINRQARTDVNNLDGLLKHYTGEQDAWAFEHPFMNAVVEAIKTLNVVKLGGNIFSSAAEIAGAKWAKAMLPTLNEFMDHARVIKLDKSELHYIGLGLEKYKMRVSAQYMEGSIQHPLLSKTGFTRLTHKAQARLLRMAWVPHTQDLGETIAFEAALQKSIIYANRLVEGKSLSSAERTWLTQMGLDLPTAQKYINEITKNGHLNSNGTYNVKFSTMDGKLLEGVIGKLQRHVAEVIVRPNKKNLPPWFSTGLGAWLTQFTSWPINAVGDKLIPMLAAPDAHKFSAAMAQTIAAMMSTYVALSLKGKEDVVHERPAEFLLTSINRSGLLGWGMNAFELGKDLISPQYGGADIFTSQSMAAGNIMGAQKLIKILKGDGSQKDVKAFTTGLTPVTTILDAMTGDRISDQLYESYQGATE